MAVHLTRQDRSVGRATSDPTLGLLGSRPGGSGVVLQRFDRDFGLPDPPSFRIIAPAGPVHHNIDNATQAGWAEETSLDIQSSYAMAPGANILLVETPVDEYEGLTGIPQIVEAENYVVDHHLGDVISLVRPEYRTSLTGTRIPDSRNTARRTR